MKNPGDRVGGDRDAKITESDGDFDGGSPRPLHASDGIAGGVVFEQELD
jgi:hypothetical protein